ncbi:MAG TPA: SDR family NAD(P)-dependent oxidoreductase [Syntrophobacteria bacterium]|nr:SDR family NAD(P)-dependent oxidoreductase [Syntrophobacteria bacterium]
MADELLVGRICLVTGSSRGIGLGAARALAAHGGTVILHGRDEGALRSALASLDSPGRHHIVTADLSDHEAIERLAVESAKCCGILHVLIHSAGILGPKVPLATYPVAAWNEVIHLNLRVPFLLTKALLPVLRKGDRPSVVFLSSGAGRRGHGGWGAYSVSKFGVEGLTQVWADELRGEGIRVNAVNPGGTRTRMRALAYPGEDPETLPTPDDIAPVFVWLARADTQVTGQNLDARDWLGRQPVA